jgi:hypothetical protein
VSADATYAGISRLRCPARAASYQPVSCRSWTIRGHSAAPTPTYVSGPSAWGRSLGGLSAGRSVAVRAPTTAGSSRPFRTLGTPAETQLCDAVTVDRHRLRCLYCYPRRVVVALDSTHQWRILALTLCAVDAVLRRLRAVGHPPIVSEDRVLANAVAGDPSARGDRTSLTIRWLDASAIGQSSPRTSWHTGQSDPGDCQALV